MLIAATRASALARWQTDHVAALLAAAHDGLALDVEVVETTADRRLDVQIWELGGKGAFVKEVQAAVLDGRARLAVHSAKDLPAQTHPALVIAAVPERADARDVLVGATIDTLAEGATVATGSLRRQVQLRALRPDLEFIGLRGNIATRLDRIPPDGAILMAAAAIDRLGLAAEMRERGIVTEALDVERFVPQVGQGALAVECRRDDTEVQALLAAIEHRPSRVALDAERAFLIELGGDCDLPAGAYATVGEDRTVTVRAVLAALDGSAVVGDAVVGTDGGVLGTELARSLRLALDAS